MNLPMCGDFNGRMGTVLYKRNNFHRPLNVIASHLLIAFPSPGEVLERLDIHNRHSAESHL